MRSSFKKIFIFSPSLKAGGAERVIVNLACAFVDRGYPVQLLLAQAKGEFLSDIPAGITILDLGQRHVIWALPALIRILRAEHPDILLSAQTHANLVALWAVKLAGVRTKIILSEHSTMSINASLSSRKEVLLTRLARLFYSSADAVVTISKGAAEDLAKTTGILLDKIHVIYNPIVTLALLEKARQKPNHPWLTPGSHPLVLAVGRLTAAKDYPTLLRAFARIRKQRDTHLLILGEGEKRTELEALVRSLGLENNVKMPGYEPNPYAYMAHASVFVLSSAWEGFANVLAEALACGTSVVSTDCKSGPAEILDNGRYGALVPVGDDEKLAREILIAIDSQTDRKVLQARGKTFSVEQAADAYLNLFSSFFSGKE